MICATDYIYTHSSPSRVFHNATLLPVAVLNATLVLSSKGVSGVFVIQSRMVDNICKLVDNYEKRYINSIICSISIMSSVMCVQETSAKTLFPLRHTNT